TSSRGWRSELLRDPTSSYSSMRIPEMSLAALVRFPTLPVLGWERFLAGTPRFELSGSSVPGLREEATESLSREALCLDSTPQTARTDWSIGSCRPLDRRQAKLMRLRSRKDHQTPSCAGIGLDPTLGPFHLAVRGQREHATGVALDDQVVV